MNAYFYRVDGKLWFHLDRPANTQPAVPFEFDGAATEDHKKQFASQLKAFEESENKVEIAVDAMFLEEEPLVVGKVKVIKKKVEVQTIGE